MKFSSLESIDVTNKVVVITGANAGLGFEAARYFASRNAIVIGAVRSSQKGANAKSAILERYPNAKIHFFDCDLSRRQSIEAFAKQVIETTSSIDILLNNAGIMAVPFALNDEGFEMQLGVNHLGHFRLTALLFQHLNMHARIINVSSMAHVQGRLDINDPFFLKRPYHSFKSYAQSKLANLLFTLELNKRIKNDPRQVVALSAHPGVAMTSLFDKVEVNSFMKTLKPFFSLFASSAFQGTKPLLMACLDPHAKANNFYGPGGRFAADSITLSKMSPLARNEQLANALWTLSNTLTEMTFFEENEK